MFPCRFEQIHSLTHTLWGCVCVFEPLWENNNNKDKTIIKYWSTFLELMPLIVESRKHIASCGKHTHTQTYTHIQHKSQTDLAINLLKCDQNVFLGLCMNVQHLEWSCSSHSRITTFKEALIAGEGGGGSERHTNQPTNPQWHMISQRVVFCWWQNTLGTRYWSFIENVFVKCALNGNLQLQQHSLSIVNHSTAGWWFGVFFFFFLGSCVIWFCGRDVVLNTWQ